MGESGGGLMIVLFVLSVWSGEGMFFFFLAHLFGHLLYPPLPDPVNLQVALSVLLVSFSFCLLAHSFVAYSFNVVLPHTSFPLPPYIK